MWPGPFLEDDVITSIGMLHSIQMLAIVRIKLFHCNCSYVIINYTMHVHTYAKQKHPGCKKRRGQSEAAVIK